MKEVSKTQFKEIYFRLGGGASTGWDLEYWNTFFKDEKIPGMKYLIEEPATPEHDRMMIVTDTGSIEYRLFFLTEESEEFHFEFPNENQDKAQHNNSLQPTHTAHHGLPGSSSRPFGEPAKQARAHVPFFPCGQGMYLFWAPLAFIVASFAISEQFPAITMGQRFASLTFAVDFLLSAIVAFGMTYHTIYSQPCEELEIRTGREWFRRPTHSLFWLRSQYWGFGYLGIAVAIVLLAPAGR
ncbi:MAG: hypothetical protein WCP20_14120 [Desulfuromonadales bacterium]